MQSLGWALTSEGSLQKEAIWRQRQTHTQGDGAKTRQRRPCEEGGRGWKDTARSQGSARSWILPVGSKGACPASALWTPGLQTVEQSGPPSLCHSVVAATRNKHRQDWPHVAKDDTEAPGSRGGRGRGLHSGFQSFWIEMENKGMPGRCVMTTGPKREPRPLTVPRLLVCLTNINGTTFSCIVQARKRQGYPCGSREIPLS